MKISHKNIIYARCINPIGGVETYVYELVKKYKDKDIAVVCKSIAPAQKKRIQEYCKVYIHTNQEIECEVAIINWDTSIIDFINKGAKIYQGIHADYSHPSQGKVPEDDRITTYLAITEDVRNNFVRLTGRKNVIICRNPLELEEDKPFLVLISATRLTEEKGGDLMLALANALDRLGIDYIWPVFTTHEYDDNKIWQNKNIIYMNNRLDVGRFIAKADWLIQPSKCEGDSYTLKEALYRGVPIVARKLKYFDEIGIEEGKNALFINEDNVEEVAKKLLEPLKFKFKHIEDGYKDLLFESKSHYEEDRKMKVEVQCIQNYTSMRPDEDGAKEIPIGKVFTVSRERADELLAAPALVKELREFKEETTTKEEVKEEQEVVKKENKKKK